MSRTRTWHRRRWPWPSPWTIPARWTAPRCALLAGVMTLVASTSLNRASNDLGTIDQGSIPSVNYTQSMAQLVSQIDAQAADFLAAAGLTATRPCSIQTSLAHPDQGETLALTVHDCDTHSIDAETVLLNEQLFNAEHNVTYPGEQ